jgi:hypothetical protein
MRSEYRGEMMMLGYRYVFNDIISLRFDADSSHHIPLGQPAAVIPPRYIIAILSLDMAQQFNSLLAVCRHIGMIRLIVGKLCFRHM